MKKTIPKYILFICLCITLCGCNSKPNMISSTGVYFDTVISVTLYDTDENARNCLSGCFEIADSCENLFSKSIDTSDVARINASNGTPVKVSKETIDIIKESTKYSEKSYGKFSVVCGALTSLWNISAENPYIPTDEEISEALKHVGDDKITYNENDLTVTLLDPEAKVDFGAVAKGYIADSMKKYLIDNGINSGIISLGGNILLIGSKPSGKSSVPYAIGIQKPFSNNGNDMITSLNVSDTSVVTSGNYQRYFKKDGIIYHHIIDLTTGYPAETGLNSVSIVCPSSIDADMLSTICFLLGKDDGVKLVESLDNTNALFVSDKNEIIYFSE